MKKIFTTLGVITLLGATATNISAFKVANKTHITDIKNKQNIAPSYKYQVLGTEHFSDATTFNAFYSVGWSGDFYVAGANNNGDGFITKAIINPDGTYSYQQIMPASAPKSVIYSLWVSQDESYIIAGSRTGVEFYKLQPDGSYKASYLDIGKRSNTVEKVVYDPIIKNLYIAKAIEGIYIVHFGGKAFDLNDYTTDHYQNFGGLQYNSNVWAFCLQPDHKLFFSTNTPPYDPMLFEGTLNAQNKYTFKQIKTPPITDDTAYGALNVSYNNKVFCAAMDQHNIAIGVLQSDGTYKVTFDNIATGNQWLTTAMSTDGKTIIASNGPSFYIGTASGAIAGQYTFHQEVIPDLNPSDLTGFVGMEMNAYRIYAGTTDGVAVGTKIPSA